MALACVRHGGGMKAREMAAKAPMRNMKAAAVRYRLCLQARSRKLRFHTDPQPRDFRDDMRYYRMSLQRKFLMYSRRVKAGGHP